MNNLHYVTTKMEGYASVKDGYVTDIKFVHLQNAVSEVFAIKSHAKPRTQKKDPINRHKYYNVWLIIDDDDDGFDNGLVPNNQ